MTFHPLSVAKTIERIGGQAKTVVFVVPPELKETFAWQAGQHITLRFNIDGEEVRRSYTISASPDTQEPLQITVKRVKGGLISNHINDTLTEGAVVDVMPPSGKFTLTPQTNTQRTHYFFGAGSGITPLYAMINTVLAAEPHSMCHLLYANRNDQTVIFKDELSWLVDKGDGGLSVSHVLSKPRWTSNFSYWSDGKINTDMIERFLSEHPPYAQDAQYYICGPGSMNGDIKQALMSLDVPAERIHFESFGGYVELNHAPIQGISATLSVRLNGQEHRVPVAESQTLLEAMRQAGLDAPFSCQSGVCGTCQTTLTEGQVAMNARMALEDDDIAQGKILTCQAWCQTKQVGVVFDVD